MYDSSSLQLFTELANLSVFFQSRHLDIAVGTERQLHISFVVEEGSNSQNNAMYALVHGSGIHF